MATRPRCELRSSAHLRLKNQGEHRCFLVEHAAGSLLADLALALVVLALAHAPRALSTLRTNRLPIWWGWKTDIGSLDGG